MDSEHKLHADKRIRMPKSQLNHTSANLNENTSNHRWHVLGPFLEHDSMSRQPPIGAALH